MIKYLSLKGQIVIFVFTVETFAEMIEDLLQFWTAYPDLPSMNEKLKVGFLPMQSDKVLAVANACFNSLNIPTCHADFSQLGSTVLSRNNLTKTSVNHSRTAVEQRLNRS